MSILLLDVKIHTEFTRFFYNGCRLHCLSSTIGNLSSMLPSSSSYVASRYPLPGTRLSKYLKVRVISLQVVFFDSTWSFYASKCYLHDCRKGGTLWIVHHVQCSTYRTLPDFANHLSSDSHAISTKQPFLRLPLRIYSARTGPHIMAS